MNTAAKKTQKKRKTEKKCRAANKTRAPPPHRKGAWRRGGRERLYCWLFRFSLLVSHEFVCLFFLKMSVPQKIHLTPSAGPP